MGARLIPLAIAATVLAAPAVAGPTCFPGAVRIKPDAPNTVFHSQSLTDDGVLLEIVAFADGTFSILATTPGGPTCIIGRGHSFFRLPTGERA